MMSGVEREKNAAQITERRELVHQLTFIAQEVVTQEAFQGAAYDKELVTLLAARLEMIDPEIHRGWFEDAAQGIYLRYRGRFLVRVCNALDSAVDAISPVEVPIRLQYELPELLGDNMAELVETYFASSKDLLKAKLELAKEDSIDFLTQELGCSYKKPTLSTVAKISAFRFENGGGVIDLPTKVPGVFFRCKYDGNGFYPSERFLVIIAL